MDRSTFTCATCAALLALVGCDDGATTSSSGGGASSTGSTSSTATSMTTTSSSTTSASGTTTTTASASGSSSSGTPMSCTPGATQACYSGPAGTMGVGACLAGTETCNATGDGYGPCIGEILPTSEECATPEDESCDGAGCGDALWSRALGIGIVSGSGAAMDVAAWRGGAVVAGAFQSSDPTLLNGVGYLRFAPDGVLTEVRKLQDGLSVSNMRIAPVDGGGLAIAAMGASGIDLGGGPLSGLVVAHLGATGQHVWSKAFAANFNDFVTDVDERAGGPVVVVGVTLDGIDVGGGMLPAGAFIATLDVANGTFVHQVSLGNVTQIPAVTALPSGRFAVALQPNVRIFDAALTEICSTTAVVGTSPSIAFTAANEPVVASVKSGAVELAIVSPTCDVGAPISIPVTSPTRPQVSVAENGDLFVSSGSSMGHVVARRSAAGAGIWLTTFPSSALNDQRMALLFGTSPVVLSLVPSGTGVDYGDGALPLGVSVARIAN